MSSDGVWDSDGNEMVPLLTLLDYKRQRKELRQALRGLLRGYDGKNPCWCGMVTGNPMMPTHSAACVAARRALVGD